MGTSSDQSSQVYETNGSYDHKIGRYKEISCFGLRINSIIPIDHLCKNLTFTRKIGKIQLTVTAKNGKQISRLYNHKMWDPGKDFKFRANLHIVGA